MGKAARIFKEKHDMFRWKVKREERRQKPAEAKRYQKIRTLP